MIHSEVRKRHVLFQEFSITSVVAKLRQKIIRLSNIKRGAKLSAIYFRSSVLSTALKEMDKLKK